MPGRGGVGKKRAGPSTMGTQSVLDVVRAVCGCFLMVRSGVTRGRDPPLRLVTQPRRLSLFTIHGQSALRGAHRKKCLLCVSTSLLLGTGI